MDSLDDVSAGGRVTRSLRKRLTSVDSSDAGSRPNTPQLKLVSIPELSSPSRPLRSTRRNSTTSNGTPLKTPTVSRTSTISDSQDIENSLSKRAARRSLISGTDSHTPMKTTTMIEELSEEENNLIRKNTPARRSKRIPSKSPTQLEVEKNSHSGPAKKLKPGPKSRRSKQMSDSDSEVEVINLEENADKGNYANLQNQTKSPTRISPRLKAKNVTPKTKDKVVETIDLSEEIVVHNKEDSTLQINVVDDQGSSKSKELVKNNAERSHESQVTNIEVFKLNSPDTASDNKNDLTDISKNDSTLRLELSDVDIERDAPVNTPEKYTPKSEQNSRNREGPCVESFVMLQKLSPKVIAKFCVENTVESSPPNSKSVTFDDVAGEDEMGKNIYPKTPASIKSKSYITMMDSSKESDDKSFQSDKGSSASFKDASAYIEECKDQGNQSKESVEFHDATNGPEEDNFENAVEIVQERTPQKQKLHTKLQSSTPMIDTVPTSLPDPQESLENIDGKTKSRTTSPEKLPIISKPTLNNNGDNTTNQAKILPSPVKEEEPPAFIPQQHLDGLPTTDNSVSSTAAEPINTKGGDKEDLFSKSWTHNVSACATSAGKIDTITEATPGNKADQEVISQNIKLADKPKTTPAEEESEEEGSFLKLQFVDDEAMEASDNYESGDSMEDGERREMEENVILDDGESIGSVDTVSDGSNEDADENASFITSDESLIDYSDEDKHLTDNCKKFDRSKSKSRMLITSESEGEEETLDEKKLNVTNDKSETKAEIIRRSKRSNRVIDSESENEDISESISKGANGGIGQDSEKSSKAFSCEVSRMIDESADEEVSLSENSAKTLNRSSKEKTKDLNEEAQEENVSNNGCDDNSGDILNHSLEELSAVSLNVVNNGSNEGMNELKNSKIREECEDKHSSDVNTSNQNVTTNKFDNCFDRKEKEIPGQSQTERKARKLSNTTDASEVPLNISTEANILISKVDKRSSHNTFELNISTTVQNQSSETNDINELTENIEDDIEIPETQEAEPIYERTKSDEIDFEECTVEDTIKAPKPKNTGLSGSFCQAEQKRNSVEVKQNVNVFPKENDNQVNKSGSSELSEKERNEMCCNVDNGSSESGLDSIVKTNDVHVGKEEDSRKHFSVLNRKRKSMASLDARDAGEPKNSKKPNRKSLQLISSDEFNPSQSLIESIEHCKLELKAEKASSKSRLSKSLCEPVVDRSNALTKSSSSDISRSENENHASIPRNLNENKRKDLGHIIDRCDEILEAANRAKLESKKNYKKSMAICPNSKKSAKRSVSPDNGSVMVAPIAKDEKHLKEKTRLALEQAFKASAKILMSEAAKDKKEKMQTNQEPSAGKRLPEEVLESLSNSELPIEIKKNHKETHSAIVQRMNYATGEIVEEALSPPRKKRAICNKFELPTGIVLEEPITPKKKQTNNAGFRESPITPRTLGFKVRHILTAGQDEAPKMQTSGMRKRKPKIEDPKRVLPKPQWSQSGVFLEEVLPSYNEKQIHKFKASSAQTIGAGAGTATLNALNFKNSTMFRKNITRESAHELVNRKERQFARNHF